MKRSQFSLQNLLIATAICAVGFTILLRGFRPQDYDTPDNLACLALGGSAIIGMSIGLLFERWQWVVIGATVGPLILLSIRIAMRLAPLPAP